MRLPHLLPAILLAFCGTQVADAQVVQLPTFRTFSVGTTVVVPDRGAAYLGGVNRASYGSTSLGVPLLSKLPGAGRLFGNRSSGQSVSSTSAWVTATIHDLEAMDRAVLDEAARRRGIAGSSPSLDPRAAFLTRHVARYDPGAETAVRHATPPNRAEDRERSRSSSVEASFELARRAEAAGRLGAARCQYQRVVRHGEGQLKTEALARLAKLRAPEADATLALDSSR